MADAVLDRHLGGGGLVVAGNAHTPLVEASNGIPMGSRLARALPGLRTVTIRYRRGHYYNLGARRFVRARRPRPLGLSGRAVRWSWSTYSPSSCENLMTTSVAAECRSCGRRRGAPTDG